MVGTFNTFNAYCGGSDALQIAIINASLEFSKPNIPQKPANRCMALSMFSVVVSSVLKKKKFNYF